MIRISVPKAFEEVARYFQEEACRHDLFMIARDDDRDLAVCRFKYRAETVSVFEIREIDERVPGAVLDGLVRNVLFLTADAGCECCELYHYPERMQGYFEGHGFKEKEGRMVHESYPDAFFKPCPGCSHAAQ